MKRDSAPVIIEEIFKAELSRVWQAITLLPEMKEWYFDNIDEFAPVPGSKSEFAVHSGKRIFTHQWTVCEVKAREKICYYWKYKEYEGEALVCFELLGEGSSTKFRLTHQVLSDFPDDIPEFKRESCNMGWDYFIRKNLKNYLEK